MKLLLISNYPIKYRVDFYNRLYDLCDNGKNIRFLFFENQGQEQRKICDYQAKFLQAGRIGKGWFWNFLLVFYSMIFFHPQNAIVNGFSPYASFALIMGRITGCKVYVWWAGTFQSEINIHGFRLKLRKFLARLAYGGIFYSPDTEAHFLSLNPRCHRRFVLGNNTRDAHAVFNRAQSFASQHQCNDARLHLITTAFQTPRKNTIELLKAAKIIIDNNEKLPPFVIDIVGDGSELQKLKKYTMQYNLPVVFHGHKDNDEVFKILINADIFIQPSLLDQWPQSYTEAMCCGKPALLSYTSGVSNAYTQQYGEHVLFDANNPNDLAQKIISLLRDEQLRMKLAKASKETAFNCDGITQSVKLLHFLNNKT